MTFPICPAACNNPKVPFFLNTQYPLKEFLLEKESPQRGSVLKISSIDTVANLTRIQYIVFSHSDEGWGQKIGLQDSVKIQRIYGLDFSFYHEYKQLLLHGRQFSPRFAMAETSELDEELGPPRTSYVVSVISNDYFEDLRNWSQKIRDVLESVLPSALITCVQDYALYQPAENVSSMDISPLQIDY